MRKGHRKGFLLVEVLISIFILIMVAATGVSLVVYGYRAINYNGNSMEASWLAQECANTLRGIRDTNWLRFSYDKENCWHMAGTDGCAPGSAIQGGHYTLEISPADSATPPRLQLQDDGLSLENGISDDDETFRLHYHSLEKSGEAERQFLSHDADDSIGESKFFRVLEVVSAGDERIDAVCTVAWFEGSRVETITLPATITSYLTD